MKKVIKKTTTPTADVKPAVKPTVKLKKPVATAPDPITGKTPAETKVEKAQAAAKPSINKGKTTGMRVMAYQDFTLSKQADRKLSDDALAADWQREFPNARCQFNATIVAGVRRLFNAGKHGNQQLSAPKGGVLRYDDKGNVIAEKRRTRTAKADKAAA